jgi:hypothetical protein
MSQHKRTIAKQLKAGRTSIRRMLGVTATTRRARPSRRAGGILVRPTLSGLAQVFVRYANATFGGGSSTTAV